MADADTPNGKPPARIEGVQDALHGLNERLDTVYSAVREVLGLTATVPLEPARLLDLLHVLETSDSQWPSDALRSALAVSMREIALLQIELQNVAALAGGRELGRQDGDFDLNLLLDEVVALIGARARDKGIDIQCHYEGFAPMRGDEALLRRALINVLDNAIKFSFPPSQERPRRFVKIESRRHSNQGHRIILVESYGYGLLESEIKEGRIFLHGERGDLAMRFTKGSGIGLSETKRIVEMHKGYISLSSTQQGENNYVTTVAIVIPGKASL